MEDSPEGEVMIRTSERSDFMRCKQKWWWAYQEHLTPKVSAPALRFGTLIHAALEAYYVPQTLRSWNAKGPKRGPHPAKTFTKVYNAERDALGKMKIYSEPPEWLDALELGIEMMNNYIELYGQDNQYRVVAPEKAFQVDIHDADGNYSFTYVGQLDVIVQDMLTKQFGIWDHKTAAGLGVDHLSMDEQVSSYDAMAPYLYPDIELSFMMFNILRKGKKDTRPVNELGQHLNKDGTVSKNQPPPLFTRHMVFRGAEERRNLIQRAIYQAEEMAEIRGGFRPLYKSPLRGCVGMYSCQFREMCELHETGNDWESYRDAMFTKWEPYASHEEKG